MGRSAGIQANSRSCGSSSASHSSWSWSSNGSAVPSLTSTSHTLMAALAFRGQPPSVGLSSSAPTRTLTPNSSVSSRCKACCGLSPGSILPPGNSHMPANSGGAVRRATKSCRGARSESITAAPTICFFIVTAPVYGELDWWRHLPALTVPPKQPGAGPAAQRSAAIVENHFAKVTR